MRTDDIHETSARGSGSGFYPAHVAPAGRLHGIFVACAPACGRYRRTGSANINGRLRISITVNGFALRPPAHVKKMPRPFTLSQTRARPGGRPMRRSGTAPELCSDHGGHMSF